MASGVGEGMAASAGQIVRLDAEEDFIDRPPRPPLGIHIRLGGARLPDNAGADLMNYRVEMDACITGRVPRGTV